MNQEEYNQRKIDFESQKDSLPKEPSGTDVKKEYWVGCYTKDDWEFIHAELMKDGSLEDNIPTDICECPNDCLQSETRGIYLLTDTEATELQNHPKVKYLHINAAKYPGTYLSNPDDISASEPTSKTYRYASTVKHQRQLSTTLVPSSPDSSLLNRCGYQLKRQEQKIDPWYGQNETTILTDRIQQFGTGVDVDLIVCDEDMWFGHIEFCNPSGISNIKQSDNSTAASTSGPSNYIGGNVLKSGFSSSATTGVCDVLDLALDAPYYIDPAWFEADAGNRLMTRWDGTTVPVESVAREWWGDSSKRSASFSSVGTVTINVNYTRARCNGSNTAYHTGNGFHGTPCASEAYGRQYGWAYNANKWFLNLYGSSNSGIEAGFDMQKIFHQNKPNRSSDNTKNPTLSSNSWGLRQSPSTSGYYYFREGATGGSGTSYSSLPEFMDNFTGDGLNRRSPEYVDGHAAITAGDELIAAGVIFVVAAGNNNQKQVQSNHADFNNYYASSANTNYADAKTNSIYGLMNYTPTYNSLNRQGFPHQIGVDRTTTPYTYKTISIGVLDDLHTAGGLERKANYSNMGNLIDCWAAGDDTLCACDDNSGTRYNRYDAYYTYNSSNSVESEVRVFNGTSSACPIAAGLIAAKLQYNRTWTYADVKNWLANDVGDTTTSYLYSGTEATTATDSNWTDTYNLQGANLRIIYDAAVSSSSSPSYSISQTATSVNEGGNIVYTVTTTNVTDGTTLYWSLAGTAVADDFNPASLTGSFTISSNSGTFTVTVATDTVSDNGETFTASVRTGSTSGTVVATSSQVTITNVPSSPSSNETFALKFSGGNLTFSGSFSAKPVPPVPPFTGELYQKSYAALILYTNTSSQTKTSFIVTNDTFENTTVYDGKNNYSDSVMGGFTGTRTHMHARGYWGSHRMIKMSDLSYTEGSGTSPSEYARSPFTYNHSYPNNLIGANWSNNAYYTTSNTTTPVPTFSVGILTTTSGITTSGSGYIHGTASMNGYSLWGSGTQAAGMDKSRIFKTTDGGVNWTEIYSSSPYSFGGYLGAYPDYNGGKFMWWLRVSNTASVLSSSDGESWTNEGSQSNGPGSPSYHGLQEIVYNKHTSKFYYCWRSTVCKESSDGVTWTTAQTFSTKHYNVVVMFDGSMVGMTVDGSNVKFYKYPLSGTSIDWANPTLLNTSAIASDYSALPNANYPTAGVYGFTAHSSGG